jgi:DNA-binding CsgD family transcriptional regulator
MLQCESRNIIGEVCHEVICGSDSSGESFCGPNCPVKRMAALNQPIDPFRLFVGNHQGPRRWVRVLVIRLQAPDCSEPWLLHCALDDERSHRVESYFSRVMLRTSHEDLQKQNLYEMGLTRRELEVLRLLVEDETLQGIANRLNVSYATVRNHIQHILRKLDVHSIMEAVAYYLLKAR